MLKAKSGHRRLDVCADPRGIQTLLGLMWSNNLPVLPISIHPEQPDGQPGPVRQASSQASIIGLSCLAWMTDDRCISRKLKDSPLFLPDLIPITSEDESIKNTRTHTHTHIYIYIYIYIYKECTTQSTSNYPPSYSTLVSRPDRVDLTP